VRQGALPVVAITSPTNGATFSAPTAFSIEATASSANGSIARLEFFAGTNSLGVMTNGPSNLSLTNLPAGIYRLTVKVTDVTEASAISSPVTITVDQPPVVVILSPINGSSFVAPANFVLQASAFDQDGSISEVEFFAGADSMGVATSAPYMVSVTNVQAGRYTFSAKATDNAGGASLSLPVTIAVGQALPANQPPTVAILTPTNGAGFITPGNVTLTAAASDVDGQVAQVEFFAGTNSLGVVAQSPFVLVLTNPPPGIYSLTAVATDDAGAKTSSSTVAIRLGVLAPPPPAPLTLHSPAHLGNGSIQFTVTGVPKVATLIIEASRDLINWAPIATNSVTDALLIFRDDDAVNFGLRFYRIVR
jgi:hypothetical protein